MDFSSGLSDLWELFGELCEDLVRDSHRLAERLQRNPQFWTWLTVWFGLVWICMRLSRIVAERSERRIFEAAEARLSTLVLEDDSATPPAIEPVATPEAAAPVASPPI